MRVVTKEDKAFMFIRLTYITFYALLLDFVSAASNKLFVPDDRIPRPWQRKVDDLIWKLFLTPLDKRDFALQRKWTQQYMLYGDLPPKRCLRHRSRKE